MKKFISGSIFLLGFGGFQSVFAANLQLPAVQGTIWSHDGDTAEAVVVEWICQQQNPNGGWTDCGSETTEYQAKPQGGYSTFTLPAMNFAVGDRNVLGVSVKTYNQAVNGGPNVPLWRDMTVVASNLESVGAHYQTSVKDISLYNISVNPPVLTLARGQDIAQWLSNVGREINTDFTISPAGVAQIQPQCRYLLGYLEQPCHVAFEGNLGASVSLTAQLNLFSYILTGDENSLASGSVTFDAAAAIPPVALSVDTKRIRTVPNRSINGKWSSFDPLTIDAGGERSVYQLRMNLICTNGALSGQITFTKDSVDQTTTASGTCDGHEEAEIHFLAELIPGHKTDYVIYVGEIALTLPNSKLQLRGSCCSRGKAPWPSRLWTST